MPVQAVDVHIQGDAVPLIVHAPNVHQGGGRVLLLSVLDALIREDMLQSVFLDVRMDVPGNLLRGISVYRVRPSLSDRLHAEWKLFKEVSSGDSVLCLGNLPPLFRSAGRVVVFVQNRYLVDKVGLQGFSFRTRARLKLERLWLSYRSHSVDRFVVQTPSMQRVIQEHLGVSAVILPFADRATAYSRHKETRKTKSANFDFLYVASGDPHKNHRVLIEAWCLMAREGIRPSLCLTIDQSVFSGLLEFIERKKIQHNLQIQNMGHLSIERTKQLYTDAKALIYPSVLESLGLPLIEARCMNLAVLASELDYVRDVIDPEEAFDPTSALSVARAVKRHLGKKESPLPLLDAQAFILAALGQSGGKDDNRS
jgi:glycosyltransferase involved in cell wall biosynthesis